jgi:hypothetical protein
MVPLERLFEMFSEPIFNCSRTERRTCKNVQVIEHMKLEGKIISYLRKYGNTEESHLCDFGTRDSGISSEKVRKIINRMVVKGRIHRIVHTELAPPEVYISLEEPVLEGTIAFGLAAVPEITNCDASKILEEARTVAEKRVDRGPQ